MDTEKVTINGLKVEIHYDKTGKWQKDRVLFFDGEEQYVSEAEVAITLEYLYHEGFILDRRIKYEIVQQ